MLTVRASVVVSSAAATTIAAPARGGDVLWDNGPPDGSNGYNNRTYEYVGDWRALLDDFVIPPGETWAITGFRWQHIWNTLPPGSGTGMHLHSRYDAGGRPGTVVPIVVEFTGYDEIATGRTYFERPGAESWATFEPVTLGPGTYWFNGVIIGPDDDYWLVRERVHGSECWVDYSDGAGLMPGSSWFGVEADTNFILMGQVVSCPGDVDDSGEVGVDDLLVLLAAWGVYDPCPPFRVADLDEDCDVDLDDLLIVLTAWGPCER